MEKKPETDASVRNTQSKRVPTEADWGNYDADWDRKWAHDHYSGRSNEDMQNHFRNIPVEGAEDLRWMPDAPFRYYILGYRDSVMSGDLSSDAASCLLNLVLEKLEGAPQAVLPVMQDLLPTLEYVAQNQAAFDADLEIYGSFPEKLARITDALQGK